MSGMGRGSCLSHFSFGRDMNLIVLSMVIANIGTQVEQRFFPLYIRELGGSPTDIGLVASIGGLFMVLLAPIGGWATDRYRRITLYALAPCIGAIGVLMMALAPSWAWLIPGCLIGMFPGLLVGPALFGLVSDIGTEETRGSRFAYQAAGFGVCAALGPLVGGVVYKYFGYRAFLVGQAVMLCLAGFIRSRIRDPRDDARRETGYSAPAFFAGLKGALRQMLSSRQFTLFLIVAILIGIGMAATMNLFSVFMREVAGVDEARMGVVYSIAGVAGIAASIAGGVAADRMGRKPVVSLAIFGMAAGLLWFTGARTMASLGAVWLFQGFAGSLAGPAVEAYLADMTDKDSRGTVRSVFNSLQNLVLMPAPLLGGFLYDRVAPAAPFWFGATVLILTLLIVVLWLKEPRRAKTVPVASAAPVGGGVGGAP